MAARSAWERSSGVSKTPLQVESETRKKHFFRPVLVGVVRVPLDTPPAAVVPGACRQLPPQPPFRGIWAESHAARVAQHVLVAKSALNRT